MKLTEEEVSDLYHNHIPSLSNTAAKMAGITNDAGESVDTPINDILAQRGTRYGSFKDHANLSQQLQQVIFTHAATHQTANMSPYMVEAITMICHKLARIANGDPFYDDSWKDIAGYSQLVVDILHGKST